jgi:hypothetical protein
LKKTILPGFKNNYKKLAKQENSNPIHELHFVEQKNEGIKNQTKTHESEKTRQVYAPEISTKNTFHCSRIPNPLASSACETKIIQQSLIILTFFFRVVDPDPYWIRIQLEAWIRIRIRNTDTDPDPGGQK